MEFDPPNPENSNQVAEGTTSAHKKTYNCTFCKRGFSNAQALGGHMNIHRRDRAKLKEPSTVITRKYNPSSSPRLPSVVSIEPGSSLVLESSDNKACTLWQPSQTVTGELWQLQLFEERPLSSKHHKSGSDERETKTTGDGYKELDLELRLGPES